MKLSKKNQEVISKMAAAHGQNRFSLPRISKVVLNTGVGDYKENRDVLARIEKEIAQIAGQRPRPTQAKASISGFKTRKGEKIGFSVTMQGQRMWDFLDRLINIVFPRLRDFEGIAKKSFDKSNNFTVGIKEQIIFPEIDPNEATIPWGLSITVVMKNAHDRNLVDEYLKNIGFVLQ